MIEHQHSVPGPIDLLTWAMATFKSQWRFYGTLALLSAGQAILFTIMVIALRSQPVWIQFPLQLCLTLLSIFVSTGFWVAIIGAMHRSMDGVAATWAGVGDDLRRSFVPHFRMIMHLAIRFGLGLVVVGVLGGILIRPFAKVLMDLPEVYGNILYVIFRATVVIAISYLGLRVSLASAAVVVGRLDPWEAIKASWVRARGNLLKMFSIHLVYVPLILLGFVPSWMARTGAQSSVDPQDPFGALNYVPPPHVDAISLISSPLLSISGLWITAALALLWLHVDGGRKAPALTE